MMRKAPTSISRSSAQKGNGKKKKSNNKQLSERDQKLLERIDKALDNYGESVKQVIYWKLENTFGVKKKAIPQYPEKLVATLEEMFGHGAILIEKSILNEVSNTVPLEVTDTTKFVEVFRSIREQ